MNDRKSQRESEFPLEVKQGSIIVRIYRAKRSGYNQFTLSYYQDGVRKRPAFASLEEAKTEAQRVATRLGSLDASVLKLTSADQSAYQKSAAAS